MLSKTLKQIASITTKNASLAVSSKFARSLSTVSASSKKNSYWYLLGAPVAALAYSLSQDNEHSAHAASKYKMLSYPENPRSFKSMIVAEFGKVEIDYPSNFKMGVENKTPEFLKMNPNGQVPTLETPEGPLWESNAMARYVARKHAKFLYGDNDYEASVVDEWIEWSRSSIEANTWPIIGPIFGWEKADKDAHEKSKQGIIKSFAVLNKWLEGKDYILGKKVSLADIILVCTLVQGVKLAFEPEYRKAAPNVVKWFDRCAALPQFKKVLGEVKWAEKELPPGALKR